MKSFFLSLQLIFLSVPALADGYPLRVIPKAECIAALETVLGPEATIENGLTAVEEVNQNKISLDSCFGEMFSDWKSKFPLKQNPTVDVITKYEQAYNDINRKLTCSNQYVDAGHDQKSIERYQQEHGAVCGGKWLSTEERNELVEKKRRLEQSYYIFAPVANAFLETFEEERKQIDREKMKLDYCQPNPYKNGSYDYFKKNHQAKCDGPLLSPDEVSVKIDLVNKLQQELNQKSSANNILVNKLAGIFTYGNPPDWIMDQFDTLQPLALALICTNPYSNTNSSGYHQWKLHSINNCQGDSGDPDGISSARKKFLDAIGNVDELKTKADQERAETYEKMKELREAAARIKYHSYNYRRLYGYFRKYLKDSGGAEDLNGFCAKYEAGLQKEKQFFETSLPDDHKVDFTDYDYGGWMPFEKYGMTEAEASILHAYINNFYAALNRSLYGGDLTPQAKIYRDTLNSALDKVPTYTGDPLLRFSTLPEDFLNKHQVGEIVTYESFTSTSKKKDWGWQSGGNARFLIYNGTSGKDIATDFNQFEQEVIFKAGTRFKVLAKEKTAKSTSFILVEVNDQGAPMASVAP